MTSHVGNWRYFGSGDADELLWRAKCEQKRTAPNTDILTPPNSSGRPISRGPIVQAHSQYYQSTNVTNVYFRLPESLTIDAYK